ncbi:hypothetical protein Q0590_00040 [Rhodocytophaga aerolata]|uniref:Tc toxin complex TcA C-terminal TcB-binding domain-containing protein n=1 Tax=Rhodocytophaga aerolata TaxID=455078 RepID=A0ABT8R044_9BACT|nr:hypothetical protein [Rhodocytophaga aerolata]MDO1444613.1 hypothetical protein [Rhodocytophaga aerolata]
MENMQEFSNPSDERIKSGKETNRRQIIGMAVTGMAGLLLSNKASSQTGGQQSSHASTISSQESLQQTAKTQQAGTIEKQFGLSKNNSLEIVSEKIDKVSFSRTQEEANTWQELRKQIEFLLGPTANNLSTGQLRENFLRVESNFKFKPEYLDDEFIPAHIEPLIDQAADLLDRCLRDRATWDELNVKMVDLALELNEYKELDKIHEEEEAAGVYDVNWHTSIADYNAERLNAINSEYNESYISSVSDNHYSFDEITKVYGAIQLSAWLQGLVPYSYQGQNFAGYGTHTWNGVAKTSAQHYKDAAVAMGTHGLYAQRYSFIAQQYFAQNQKDISRAKMKGLIEKAKWDKLNADFLRRRTLVARKYQDIKTKTATQDDGALNYAKRLVPLKERFHQDFRDALARMKAIEKGLKLIYGYNLPLPSDESSIDYFDNCLGWTRSVVQFIIKFSRRELNAIYPVSLRSLLGESNFKSQRKSGTWSFQIKESLFNEMTNIRLRGISLSIVDNYTHKDRIWQFQIQAPKDKAVDIRHFLTGQTTTLDQSHLDPCIIGRVVERESFKIPDVVGLTSLYNASPLGKWEIKALGSMPNKSYEKIDDIQVDLHLAFRWGVKKELTSKL